MSFSGKCDIRSNLIIMIEMYLTTPYFSTYDNSFLGVDTITKKSLNALTGHRSIPIQEAVHNICGLDLVICSDFMVPLSLGKALYLRKKKNDPVYKKTDLIGSYRNRAVNLEGLSLDEYFYQEFRKEKFYKDPDSPRQKDRILVPRGLQCRPRYPVTYEYARGMLIMHRPWSIRQELTPILEDKDLTVKIFLSMIGDREFPLRVLSEYNRTVQYSLWYQPECIAKEGKHSDRLLDLECTNDDEAEAYVALEHSRHLSSGESMKSPNNFDGTTGNIGLDHDWSQLFFKGDRDAILLNGDLYTQNLKDAFYNKSEEEDDRKLFIPRRKNGQDYKLEDLNPKQQAVVLCALEAMIKFVTNDPTYEPFRATIVGCGGTGKSHIINTLTAIVRDLTNCNDSIQIAAPTGGAAFNVGGCTLHRLLSLSVDSKTLSANLSEDRQAQLATKLENMLMLIIDERSMLSSSLIAGAERNLRHCVYGQQNQKEVWGGVPVVLLFGDDHQLLPVIEKGVIAGYGLRHGIKVKGTDVSTTYKTHNEQVQEAIGHDLFIKDLTTSVVNLTENYRARNDPYFAGLLDRLRIGTCTVEDAERLMKNSLHRYDDEDKRQIEDDPKTVWLFATNPERRRKNTEKLVEQSRKDNVPIARLKCQWYCNKRYGNGQGCVIRSHFKNQNNILNSTDLCVEASVCISGINIVPEAGLYNGARGKVIDLVYDTVVGPNDKHNDHLPKYVVVDFPGLKLGGAQPWDSKNPTVSIVHFNHIHHYAPKRLTSR